MYSSLLALMLLGTAAVDKPDPKTKARQLLDGAIEMLPAASPEIQAIGLYHVADAYRDLNAQRALELAKQAFAVASVLSADHSAAQREGLLCDIAIVAADRIIRKLPPGDDRRQRVFACAMAGYKVHPHEMYVSMIRDTWKEVPRPMAEAAIDVLISEILSRKEDGEYQRWGSASAKGITIFDSEQEAALFQILHIVRDINPKRIDPIFEKYPSLRSLAEQYPQGLDSLKARGALWTFIVSGDSKEGVDKLTQQQRGQMLVENRKEAEELKDPSQRMEAWDTMADAAHLAKDPQLVQQLLDRALEDAAELAKADSKAPLPNVTLREFWPSTQAYGRTIMRATAIFGIESNHFLTKIGDSNIQLLARIAMAEKLMGKSVDRWRVKPPRRAK